MKRIRISIPESEYNVYLGKDVLPSIQTLLGKENLKGDILVVIDSKVKRLYLDKISNAFKGYPYKLKYLTIGAHEKNKSYQSLQRIHSVLIKNRFGRDSVVCAVGGGIIGDIAGFAASTYMRGIKYIQIPTTLLAAVDSSVGGKTGINYENIKNIIGTFYQPSTVFIDPSFFNTLSSEELLCGIGEIIKYCFLIDKKYFNYVNKNLSEIFNNNSDVIEKIITQSVKYKGDVVIADEKESGIRKVLNLGHTFAHAFEVEQKHNLKHGQAVIIGITCALYLSQKIIKIQSNDFNLFLDLLTNSGKDIMIKKINVDRLLEIMALDKKNRNNEIQFVLLKDIGEIITDVPAKNKLVKDSISEAILHFTQ